MLQYANDCVKFVKKIETQKKMILFCVIILKKYKKNCTDFIF